MVAPKMYSAAVLGLALALLVGCAGPQQNSVPAPGPSPAAVEDQPPVATAKPAAEVPASPRVAKQVPLSDSAELTGYTLEKSADGQTQLALYWRCLKPMTNDYEVFVHLFPTDRSALTADRRKAGFVNMDNSPRLPTPKWQVGQTYVSVHRVALPAAEYKTAVGFYSLENGKAVRMPPASAGAAGAPEQGSITIGTLSLK
jgi:hypothetical protein